MARIHQVTRESEGFFGQEITEEFPAKIHPYSSNLNKDFSIGLMTIPPPKKKHGTHDLPISMLIY